MCERCGGHMDWRSFATPDGVTGGWVAGAGDDVALLVHGGPGLSDYMDTVADEVNAALPDHRIARYQQRGLSPSAVEGPYTVAQLVDDLFAVVDHIGAAHVVLVGHSWGGFLAMAAACERPDRVAGMVLLDSLGAVHDGGQSTMEQVMTPRLSEPAFTEMLGLPERADLTPQEAGARRMELVWPGYFADPSSAPEPPEFRVDPTVNGAIMEDANRILAEGSLARAMAGLTAPSVHVIGTASPINPDVTRATATLSPAAILVELECGHFPWLERPGSVADATRLLGRR